MSRGPWKKSPVVSEERLLSVQISCLKAEIDHCDYQLKDREVGMRYWKDRKLALREDLSKLEAKASGEGV